MALFTLLCVPCIPACFGDSAILSCAPGDLATLRYSVQANVIRMLHGAISVPLRSKGSHALLLFHVIRTLSVFRSLAPQYIHETANVAAVFLADGIIFIYTVS